MVSSDRFQGDPVFDVHSGAALGLLNRLIKSSGTLHKPLHLLRGEGLLELTMVIALPLTQPLVKFVGKVKRVAGEVECIMGVFTTNDSMNR
jgi:hypothetical protein